MYTFILKDEILGPDEGSGRERASVSWEVDFRVPKAGLMEEDEEKGKTKGGKVIFMPWNDFRPTYRGREMKDVKKPIDLKAVRRMSLMTRR